MKKKPRSKFQNLTQLDVGVKCPLCKQNTISARNARILVFIGAPIRCELCETFSKIFVPTVRIIENQIQSGGSRRRSD